MDIQNKPLSFRSPLKPGWEFWKTQISNPPIDVFWEGLLSEKAEYTYIVFAYFFPHLKFFLGIYPFPPSIHIVCMELTLAPVPESLSKSSSVRISPGHLKLEGDMVFAKLAGEKPKAAGHHFCQHLGRACLRISQHSSTQKKVEMKYWAMAIPDTCPGHLDPSRPEPITPEFSSHINQWVPTLYQTGLSSFIYFKNFFLYLFGCFSKWGSL